MSGVMFRRIGGRIVPILSKATGLGKVGKASRNAQNAGAALKKATAKVDNIQGGLKKISDKRQQFASMKSHYEKINATTGTKIRTSMWEADDARLVGQMRKLEPKLDPLLKKQARAKAMKDKADATLKGAKVSAALKTGSIGLGVTAAMGALFKSKSKNKTGV